MDAKAIQPSIHGIEIHSPKTWIAYEQDENPNGRAIYWLCDEDMLPKMMPQTRIWAYDYNSNCYSDDAQHVDILELGETFLEILWGAKDQDVGRRSLIFIGSCFGGVVVAQVGLPISMFKIVLVIASLANNCHTAGIRQSLSRLNEVRRSLEVNRRRDLLGYSFARDSNSKHSGWGRLDPRIHGQRDV